jgi:excinuclease UvrABC helicase subunit UvrB|tara:strand:- start:339 stop:530 length:192 start_codon:yes stop_codon:yes gene_type:complete
MSKIKEEYKKEAKKMEKPEIKEVIKNLKSQMAQHERQSGYHKEMALKAQGAIEILEELDNFEE